MYFSSDTSSQKNFHRIHLSIQIREINKNITSKTFASDIAIYPLKSDTLLLLCQETNLCTFPISKTRQTKKHAIERSYNFTIFETVFTFPINLNFKAVFMFLKILISRRISYLQLCQPKRVSSLLICAEKIKAIKINLSGLS